MPRVLARAGGPNPGGAGGGRPATGGGRSAGVRIAAWPLQFLRGIGHAVQRLLAANTGARIDIWNLVEGLLEAKFDLRQSLEIALEAHEGELAKPGMLRKWLRAYQGGNEEFVRELARWAPASEAMIFHGLGLVLPQHLFRSAARIAEMRSKQVRAVVAALWMPVVFAVGSLGLLWMCGGYLMPAMLTISPPERWGLMGSMFGHASLFVYDNDVGIGIAFLVAFLVLRTIVLRWTGAGRARLDRFAPFSLYRILSGSAFLFTALEFVRLGVDLNTNTFNRLSAGASPYVRSRIRAIQLHMSQGGQGFGKAMKAAGTGFPDVTLVTVAAALDGREQWEEVLAEFVERWVDRSEALMRAQAAVLSIVLMVAGTVMLGAMINAMFEIMGSATAYGPQ